MRFRDDESGSAFAWFVAIVGIFGLTLIWLMMTPAVLAVNSNMRNVTDTTLNVSSIEYQSAQGVFNSLAGIWRWLPLIYSLGLIAWAIVWSVVREAGRLL